MAESGATPPGFLRVTVVYSPQPRSVLEWTLLLPPRATVLQALEASGLREACPELNWGSLVVGVWGRKARLEQALRENDRVEIYRPLEVDPKMARRERFRKQGSRAAGLFARKRDGSRPGN